MTDVQAFINGYREPEAVRISFAWNGQHADKLVDQNYNFRKEVLEEVLKAPEAVSILLIRDLFEAETNFAKEAWCVDSRVSNLARVLLTRGGPAFVEDFFRGKYRGQDAYMAAGSYPEFAKSLIDEVDKKLASNPPAERRRLLELAKQDCERWLKA